MLAPRGALQADLGGPGVTSALIKHGLRFFRPSYSLPADTTMDLIRYRLPRLQGLRCVANTMKGPCNPIEDPMPD